MKVGPGQSVWVTYSPGPDCLCWMDAVCTHGWTWQDNRECCHDDHVIDDVHVSLADAVRSLFQDSGAQAIGCLLRDKTLTVYVMPPADEPWHCDHDALGGQYPSPYRVVERKESQPRSRPGDDFRKFYRPVSREDNIPT